MTKAQKKRPASPQPFPHPHRQTRTPARHWDTLFPQPRHTDTRNNSKARRPASGSNAIPSHAELHPVRVVRTKEIVPLFLVLPCFGDVHRDPSMFGFEELRPAVIAGNLAECLAGGSGKPISNREGMACERAIAMNREWKSVQFPFLASQAYSTSPCPQPVPVLS